MIDVELPVVIERQPDYTTCGPTSLHAIYHYWGDPIDLKTVIAETEKLPGGGTLGVHLSVHALRRGYEVDTWICNVRHFDPTWFQQPTDLRAKIRARFEAKGLASDPRYEPALRAMEEYFDLGGGARWGDLSPALLGQVLGEGTPLITGVDGTYLYQCIRETEQGPDDVKGDGFGHFLVLCGYRSSDDSIAISDPLKDNPLHGTKYYRASAYRVIGSIFLGIASDDGNLLRIRPKDWKARLGKRAS
jgi:hypothetical protein